jgi:hypothetical protein
MPNDNQTYSEQLDELFKAHFEQHFKNANLLLVGHAGALVACLTVLREYSNVPKLHGIGAIIAIECAGLIAASGHVNRTYRPNTWLHRPMLQT